MISIALTLIQGRTGLQPSFCIGRLKHNFVIHLFPRFHLWQRVILDLSRPRVGLFTHLLFRLAFPTLFTSIFPSVCLSASLALFSLELNLGKHANKTKSLRPRPSLKNKIKGLRPRTRQRSEYQDEDQDHMVQDQYQDYDRIFRSRVCLNTKTTVLKPHHRCILTP